MSEATWKLCSPALNGYQSNPGAPLTVSYSLAVDCRWNDLVLGPLLTDISCATATDGTLTNVRAGAFTEGISHGTGAEKLVLGRGTKPAIIDLATRANVADGSFAGFSSAVTDMIYTKAADATEEVAFALDANIYQVGTVFPNTGSFTASANDESNIFRVFGKGASTSTSIGVAYGMGKGAGSVENLIRSNILTGTVHMDASAWATRATVSGEPITFTGMVAVGDQFIVCTSNGPYLLNDIYQRFEPLMPELDNNANNGKNAFSWSALGAFVPSTTGLRLFRSIYDSESVGPEVYLSNSSPIKGRMTAGWATARWAYVVFYDAINDDSWICAARPSEQGDWTTNPVAYFPIARLHNLDCEFGAFAGQKGSQTQPTHYVGQDSNAGWFTDGVTDQRPDDTNVTYASTGTVYGTELRLSSSVKLKSLGFMSGSCTTANFLTPTIGYMDSNGVQQTVALAPVTTNGWQQLDLSRYDINTRDASGMGDGVRWFHVEIAFTTGTATQTPKVLNEGRVTLTWE